MFLPESNEIVVSTHVKFTTMSSDGVDNLVEEEDSNIPEVSSNPGRKRKIGESVEDFKWLVHSRHIDDEDHLLYETTKIYTYKGDIVCDRKRVNTKGELETNGYDGPYHVKSIVTLTNDYSNRFATALTSLNSDDCSLTSHGNLSREATKPGVLDRSHLHQKSRNVLMGIECEPNGVATQGPGGFLSHLSYRSSVQDVLNCEGEANVPDANLSCLYSNSTSEYIYNCIDAGMSCADIRTPNSHRHAMATPQREEWKKAEEMEIESMVTNKVFKPALLPSDRRAIRVRWIYRIKYNKDGAIKQYKARIVALGYQQIFGVDYSETYSPVARLTSLRILLAISSHYGLLVNQMDVDTAFLNAALKEEIIYIST